MDEYSLLTSEKERSFGEDLENSTCSTSKTWEEFPLISDDEEFSLVSSDDEEPLSPSQLMDKKDPAAAEHSDSPSCSFAADEYLNEYNVRPSETEPRATRKRTDHPTTVVSLESEETSSSDNSISSHTRAGDTRVRGPSEKEIKESRKKDKGMYWEMLKSLCPSIQRL